MAQYTVRQGKRYRADITLSWIESFATNEMIAEKLTEVGFADVEVIGSGSNRTATATWPLEDASADVPSQVSNIYEDQDSAATYPQGSGGIRGFFKRLWTRGKG